MKSLVLVLQFYYFKYVLSDSINPGKIKEEPAEELQCGEVRKALKCRQILPSFENPNYEHKKEGIYFKCENGSVYNYFDLSQELIKKCSKENNVLDYVVVYVTICSSILLSLTILTYMCLPQLLNIHGKAILCHLLNQLMSSGFQIAGVILLPRINTWGEYDEFLSCWVIGFGLYFFIVSSNAWLMVVNFDLWNTFRCKYQRDYREDRKRFLIYSVFGWGIPIIAATSVGILEATLPQGHNYKPNIGTDRCFLSFENTHSIILFFYVVVGLMLAFNLVIFTWTNIILCSVQSKVAKARQDSHAQQVWTRFFLFLKLFCVMGTTWVISLVLWILGYDKIHLEDQPSIVRFFQLFNVFHGFCYFIVFVCKPSIFKMMKQKFCGEIRADDSERGTSSRSSRHTSSTVLSTRRAINSGQ